MTCIAPNKINEHSLPNLTSNIAHIGRGASQNRSIPLFRTQKQKFNKNNIRGDKYQRKFSIPQMQGLSRTGEKYMVFKGLQNRLLKFKGIQGFQGPVRTLDSLGRNCHKRAVRDATLV